MFGRYFTTPTKHRPVETPEVSLNFSRRDYVPPTNRAYKWPSNDDSLSAPSINPTSTKQFRAEGGGPPQVRTPFRNSVPQDARCPRQTLFEQQTPTKEQQTPTKHAPPGEMASSASNDLDPMGVREQYGHGRQASMSTSVPAAGVSSTLGPEGRIPTDSWDRNGRVRSPIYGSYHVSAIPQTLSIGADGSPLDNNVKSSPFATKRGPVRSGQDGALRNHPHHEPNNSHPHPNLSSSVPHNSDGPIRPDHLVIGATIHNAETTLGVSTETLLRAPPSHVLHSCLAQYDAAAKQQIHAVRNRCRVLEFEVDKMRSQVTSRDDLLKLKETEAEHALQRVKALEEANAALDENNRSLIIASKKIHADVDELSRTRQMQVTALQNELDAQQDALSSEKATRMELHTKLNELQESLQKGKEAVKMLATLQVEWKVATSKLSNVNIALAQARDALQDKDRALTASQRIADETHQMLLSREKDLSTMLSAVAVQLKSPDLPHSGTPTTVLEVPDVVSALQQTMAARTQQLHDARSDLIAQQALNGDLQARIDILERLLPDVEGLDESVDRLQSAAIKKLTAELAERRQGEIRWEEALRRMSEDMEIQIQQVQGRSQELSVVQKLYEEAKAEQALLASELAAVRRENATVQKLLEVKEGELRRDGDKNMNDNQQELQRLRDQVTGSDQREKVATRKLLETTTALEEARRKLNEHARDKASTVRPVEGNAPLADSRSALERYEAKESTVAEKELADHIHADAERQQSLLLARLKEAEDKTQLSKDRCAKLENRARQYQTLVDELKGRNRELDGKQAGIVNCRLKVSLGYAPIHGQWPRGDA